MTIPSDAWAASFGAPDLAGPDLIAFGSATWVDDPAGGTVPRVVSSAGPAARGRNAGVVAAVSVDSRADGGGDWSDTLTAGMASGLDSGLGSAGVKAATTGDGATGFGGFTTAGAASGLDSDFGSGGVKVATDEAAGTTGAGGSIMADWTTGAAAGREPASGSTTADLTGFSSVI